MFIDTLTFELSETSNPSLRAVLKDESGIVCSMLDTTVEPSQKVFRWNGLNDLPYGIYTLQLWRGTEEQLVRLVKRV